MAFIFLLLYILNGQPVLVQNVHKTEAACVARGNAEVITLHPDAIVLFAACGKIDAQSAKAN